MRAASARIVGRRRRSSIVLWLSITMDMYTVYRAGGSAAGSGGAPVRACEQCGERTRRCAGRPRRPSVYATLSAGNLRPRLPLARVRSRCSREDYRPATLVPIIGLSRRAEHVESRPVNGACACMRRLAVWINDTADSRTFHVHTLRRSR